MNNKTNNKTFAIGIPTVNRWDLLQPSLAKYQTYFPSTEIYIIDNGNQGIPASTVNTFVTDGKGGSVAQSWNMLCQLIFNKHQNAVILNDDVYIDFTEASLFGFLCRFPDADLYRSQNGFCSFIIPASTWNIVGNFDINFKGAYFEDRDYERRCKLKKLDILAHKFLNPYTMVESGSIQKDPSLNSNYQNNAEYYVKKWGGNVGGEKYLTPFNQ